MTGSAIAPAARCKNVRRGRFIGVFLPNRLYCTRVKGRGRHARRSGTTQTRFSVYRRCLGRYHNTAWQADADGSWWASGIRKGADQGSDRRGPQASTSKRHSVWPQAQTNRAPNPRGIGTKAGGRGANGDWSVLQRVAFNHFKALIPVIQKAVMMEGTS